MPFPNMQHRVPHLNYAKTSHCFVSDCQSPCLFVYVLIFFDIENAARAYGLGDAELFQTIDLFEKHNIAQVTQCIFALGRNVSDDYSSFSMGMFVCYFRHRKRNSMDLYSVRKCLMRMFGNLAKINYVLDKLHSVYSMKA